MQYTKAQIEEAMIHLKKARNTNAIGLVVSIIIFLVLLPLSRVGFGALIVGAYELFKVIQLTGRMSKLEALLQTASEETLVEEVIETPIIEVESSESTL